MANRIKGITIEIGDDTTKLSKALEGVNKNIKNTQTQLKDVQKLLKLDPSNTMKSDLNMKLDGISGAMLTGGEGGVVNNYYNNDNSRTVNQTNNCPKSLSRLEIYRMTRNALNV